MEKIQLSKAEASLFCEFFGKDMSNELTDLYAKHDGDLKKVAEDFNRTEKSLFKLSISDNGIFFDCEDSPLYVKFFDGKARLLPL